MSRINPSQSDSLIEVNGKGGFNPTERRGLIQYKDVKKKNTGAGV
jgi:hypothetical protein